MPTEADIKKHLQCSKDLNRQDDTDLDDARRFVRAIIRVKTINKIMSLLQDSCA